MTTHDDPALRSQHAASDAGSSPARGVAAAGRRASRAVLMVAGIVLALGSGCAWLPMSTPASPLAPAAVVSNCTVASPPAPAVAAPRAGPQAVAKAAPRAYVKPVIPPLPAGVLQASHRAAVPAHAAAADAAKPQNVAKL